MNRRRADGLIFLLLGGIVFVSLGVILERITPEPLVDLRTLYFPARCLLQYGDPYSPSQVEKVYRTEGGDWATDSTKVRQIVTQLIYPPSVFLISVPMALLPWNIVQSIWVAFIAGGFIFASILIWGFSAEQAPLLSGLLIGFLVGNSEVLLVGGNAAGIVVSLCILALWCFIRNRYEAVGVICLALSLAIKPHDSGLVWIYLLIAGARFRKRALQALAVSIAMSLPVVFWVSSVSPGWWREILINISATSIHGGVSDPGPTSTGAHGLAMVVSLQAVFSIFRDDPRFYNLASYLTCAPLLVVWMWKTARKASSKMNTWLGLATIAGLTMLPVYHRQYDTKLLLLTIPACALLWAEGSRAGRFAVLVNAAAIVLNGDLTWTVILGIVHAMHVQAGGFGEKLLVGVQVFPAPLSLLASCVVFLWLYVRRSDAEAATNALENQDTPQPALNG